MNTVMLYPNEKEKAIYNYSKDLLKETKVEGITYKRSLFFFPIPFGYKKIHLQHEYNLLGGYGIPFLLLLPFMWLFSKKFIITMHTVPTLKGEVYNFCGETYRKNKFGFIRTTFYKIANFIIKHTAKNIIVHSQVFKDILIEEYGFKEERIFVIRHGVKEVPKFDKEKIKKELGLKGKVYLIIGTFHPDHQPHLAIEKVNELDGTLLIVWNSNKGKRIVDYYNKCMKNGIPKNVKVIDLAKEHKDKWWEFFYASEKVILNYIDGIGSGVFQDAMATRTPVICSNTEYFREMLKDFTNCDAYAKKYSVKNMAKKTLEVYNENN